MACGVLVVSRNPPTKLVVEKPADAYYTDTLPRGSRGVFVGLSRDGTDGAPSQRAITPDLRVRVADGLEVHYAVKDVHVGVSTYADTNGAAAARGAAVNSRARRVVGEYKRHARRIGDRRALRGYARGRRRARSAPAARGRRYGPRRRRLRRGAGRRAGRETGHHQPAKVVL